MAHDALRLADLVRINDTLTWSLDYRDSFVSAVAIVRDVVGADLAPAFMLSESGTRLELLTDPGQRERLGPEFAWMPVGPYVRPPWINPGEFPVSARDHLGEEAWAVLPPEFKAWFGTSGIVVPIHADQRHLGAILLAFDRPYALTGEVRDFLAIAGRILGSAIYRCQVAAHERELGALEERRRISEELHDDLSQQIATLGLRIESARLHAEEGELATIRADYQRLADMVEELKRTVRHEMLGLRTDGDATEGTYLAKVREHIDHFHSQFDVPVALVCPAVDAADRVPIDVGTQLLAIDADPALGLAVSLGVSPERTIGDVRERVIRVAQLRSADAERELARELDYHIMEALVERDDFAFLAMGRTEAIGCFCPVNDMLRGGIELLGGEYDTILVDGEAGIEQINRHVLPRVDALVLLTDGSVRGGRTVELLADIAVAEGVVDADGIGIVVNRQPEGADASVPHGIPVIARVPYDATVADFDVRGRSLLDVPPGSPAAVAVGALARALLPTTPTPTLMEAIP